MMRGVGGALFGIALAAASFAGCAGRSESSCADCNAGTGGEGAQAGSGAAAGRGANGGTGASSGRGGTAGSAGSFAGSTVGGSGGGGGSSGGDGPTGGDATEGGTAGSLGGTGPAGGGGAGNASGAAGAGGDNGDPCALPADTGPCDGALSRYAFDQKLGVCVPFSYGGCEGNANNFESMERCYDGCGLSGDFHAAACTSSSDCVVITRGCCGDCALRQPDPLVAVNHDAAANYPLRAGCGGIACPICDPPDPDDSAWFGATCQAGFCELFDARESSVTECTTNEDCTLRDGLGCCEGCSADARKVVAVNPEGGLGALVCGSDPVGCPACVPQYPPALEAVCNAGRCAVISLAGAN